MATEIGHHIADLADAVEALGKTTFANRLREGSYSISGILAEGSNCPTKIEFSARDSGPRRGARAFARRVRGRESPPPSRAPPRRAAAGSENARQLPPKPRARRPARRGRGIRQLEFLREF